VGTYLHGRRFSGTCLSLGGPLGPVLIISLETCKLHSRLCSPTWEAGRAGRVTAGRWGGPDGGSDGRFCLFRSLDIEEVGFIPGRGSTLSILSLTGDLLWEGGGRGREGVGLTTWSRFLWREL